MPQEQPPVSARPDSPLSPYSPRARWYGPHDVVADDELALGWPSAPLQGRRAWVNSVTDHAERDHQARHDPLTGLLNEPGFNEALLAEVVSNDIRGSRYPGERIYLGYLDLDGMKRVNDTLGHAAGDQLLIGASHLTQTDALRPGEQFGRLHGDEMVAFIYASNLDEARARTERLRSAMFDGIREQIQTNPGLFRVDMSRSDSNQRVLTTARALFGVSIGFVAVPEPVELQQGTGEPLDRIAQAFVGADAAMYREKHARHLMRATAEWERAIAPIRRSAPLIREDADWLRTNIRGGDTSSNLTALLRARDDLRWKVGSEQLALGEPWIRQAFPDSVRHNGGPFPAAMVIDAAILTELRTELGFRQSDQIVPDHVAPANEPVRQELVRVVEEVRAFTYPLSSGQSASRRSALVFEIPPQPRTPVRDAPELHDLGLNRTLGMDDSGPRFGGIGGF